MTSFLRRLRKNPDKKLNILLEEDYEAIDFFKSKGFNINYVTLSFFRVCKAKKQMIKLSVNTLKYLKYCYYYSEKDSNSKIRFYIVKNLCKFLHKQYGGIFTPNDANLKKLQSLWPSWTEECSSLYNYCTNNRNINTYLKIIENVIDDKNIIEINLECLKLEYEEFKKDSKIEKSSFINLLEQNKNLIQENERLRNKYENSEDRCPICLENVDEYIVTVCNHKFCNDCFIPWIQKENTCPVCRYNLISPVESNGLLTREEGLG